MHMYAFYSYHYKSRNGRDHTWKVGFNLLLPVSNLSKISRPIGAMTILTWPIPWLGFKRWGHTCLRALTWEAERRPNRKSSKHRRASWFLLVSWQKFGLMIWCFVKIQLFQPAAPLNGSAHPESSAAQQPKLHHRSIWVDRHWHRALPLLGRLGTMGPMWSTGDPLALGKTCKSQAPILHTRGSHRAA